VADAYNCGPNGSGRNEDLVLDEPGNGISLAALHMCIKSNYNSCWRLPMPEKVSTIEVRQRIGDMLNRVSLRHDEFIIERKGKPLAALVPVERLEQMRRFARTQAIDFLEQQMGSGLTAAEAEELAREAQAWARRPARPRTRKAK